MPETAEEIVAANPYQADDVMLVPYDENAFPPDFLVKMYFKLTQDQTLDRIFASGSQWTLNQFVYVLRDKPMVIGLDKKANIVLGMGWLMDCVGQAPHRRASLGFAFVKEAWGSQAVRTLARLALQWWTKELGFSVLYGTTLPSNRLAQNFARKMGFQRVCTLPGWYAKEASMVDAELYVLDTRERTSNVGTIVQ